MLLVSDKEDEGKGREEEGNGRKGEVLKRRVGPVGKRRKGKGG
jgi:hypothetical protein